MLRYAATLIFIALLFRGELTPQERSLEITGLRMYTEDELIEMLDLQRFETGEITAKETIDSIISFYSEHGYTLVKVIEIENSETHLRLYVDEGALGKIIFLHMDDFTTIYLQIAFRLKNKIFNINTVNENIEKLKKGRRWKNITYQLKPVKEYGESVFQLDREIDLPLLGKRQLPFFDRYSPRYDLVVIFSKSILPPHMDPSRGGDAGGPLKNGNVGKKKKIVLNKFDYGLKIHFYRGFIPFLKYYHLGLISRGDFFMADTSVGIMYGIDRKFKRPPRETFFNFNTGYFFTPTFKEVFTPSIRASLLQSKTGRPDLGLLSYHFLIMNAMLAPGITLLRSVNLYTGVGVETAFFFNSKLNKYKLLNLDPSRLIKQKNPVQEMENIRTMITLERETERRTDVYTYIEAGFIYDFTRRSDNIYELRKNRLKKEIALIYDFYFVEKTFSKVRLVGYFEHEFKGRNIYSGMLTYQFLFGKVPFYQEQSVSNQAFKGLQVWAYHSRNLLSQSNEYRISMYRDFLYIGAFFDMTLFEGTGRDVKGAQFGFVGGPTGRVLLFDHFELYLYYGWDFLVSTKKSRGYFYFNIQNKW